MANAVFSDCRRYRYTLWRTWLDPLIAQHTFRYVNFVCLNPSTADETKDDNTIRKCIKFAKSWGYDGMCVTNLFAWRSTNPKLMLKEPEPVGADNDFYIQQIASGADLVIAAWSQYGGHLNRSSHVKTLIDKPLHYLRIGEKETSEPWHPLYLPDVSRPILWHRSEL